MNLTKNTVTFENPSTFSSQSHLQEIMYNDDCIGVLIERETGMWTIIDTTYQFGTTKSIAIALDANYMFERDDDELVFVYTKTFEEFCRLRQKAFELDN